MSELTIVSLCLFTVPTVVIAILGKVRAARQLRSEALQQVAQAQESINKVKDLASRLDERFLSFISDQSEWANFFSASTKVLFLEPVSSYLTLHTGLSQGDRFLKLAETQHYPKDTLKTLASSPILLHESQWKDHGENFHSKFASSVNPRQFPSPTELIAQLPVICERTERELSSLVERFDASTEKQAIIARLVADTRAESAKARPELDQLAEQIRHGQITYWTGSNMPWLASLTVGTVTNLHSELDRIEKTLVDISQELAATNSSDTANSTKSDSKLSRLLNRTKKSRKYVIQLRKELKEIEFSQSLVGGRYR